MVRTTRQSRVGVQNGVFIVTNPGEHARDKIIQRVVLDRRRAARTKEERGHSRISREGEND